MQLPAGFMYFLTGMEATWPDGSVLFGKGVAPNVAVAPIAQDYAEGRDPFVQAAVVALTL